MPRYIDADELIKKIFPYDGVDKKEYSINAQAVYNDGKKYLTPSEVRKMTPKEVKENYDLIVQSMKYWK